MCRDGLGCGQGTCFLSLPALVMNSMKVVNGQIHVAFKR